MVPMGSKMEVINEIYPGNTLAISGLDNYIIKTGTITEFNAIDCYGIRDMKYSVSPVVRVAIKPKNPSDL